MKRKKVLHLFNQYLPQTENWAFNLISHLPETEIYIGAKHYLKNNFYHPEFTFFEHPFGEIDRQYYKLDGRDPRELRKKIVLKVNRLLLGSLRKKLLTFSELNQIEIVHAHFANVGWYFRDIPRGLKVPYIISFYGWDYECLPFTNPIFKKRYQLLFQHATLFLCEGEHGRRILERMGCPAYKIKVQKLGVKISEISEHHRIKNRNTLTLVQIATFNEKKGHLFALKAFHQILPTCPNMHLTLVGPEGDPGVKFQVLQFIKENGLSSNVKVLDEVCFSRLHEFLKDYQVFIHPSHYAGNRDCEGGAPIVLLDAQATGLPVISTFHCDIPDEVIDQKTGFLAEEGDIFRLARIIQKFYEMDNLTYQEFSRNARNHIVENYNVLINAKSLREIYESILI